VAIEVTSLHLQHSGFLHYIMYIITVGSD